MSKCSGYTKGSCIKADDHLYKTPVRRLFLKMAGDSKLPAWAYLLPFGAPHKLLEKTHASQRHF